MEMYVSEDGDCSPVNPKKQKLTALDKLLSPENLTMEPPTFDNELEKYLAELPVSRKRNPLTWWKWSFQKGVLYCSVLAVYACLPHQHPQK